MNSLFILKIICWAYTATFGIAAAWFELKDRLQTEEERKKTREYYGSLWRTIRDTGILKLPEKVIWWIVNSTKWTKDSPLKLIGKAPGWLVILFLYLLVPVATLPACIQLGWETGILFIGLPMILFAIGIHLANRTEGEPTGFINLILILTFFTVPFVSFVAGVICLKFILSLQTFWATVIMVFVSPFYAFIIAIPLLFLAIMSDEPGGRVPSLDWPILFGLALTASFSITFIAFLIGHSAYPQSWVPQTVRMICSNVVFDGLTLVATIYILSRAVSENKRASVPTVVMVDIFFATLFALAALYFGLASTDKALDIFSVIRVFFGLTPDGKGCEFGPYFWVMHTTFLPTLFYMTLIFFCWICKIFVLPIATMLSKGEVIEKPHNLTAGAFLFIGAIFMAFSGLLTLID